MGKIEELHRAVVEQFAAAHVKDATGQKNFIAFMQSLYDLDEDPIFKDWLSTADDVVDVVQCYPNAPPSERMEGNSQATSEHGVKCVRLDVADMLSTYENEILGPKLVKESKDRITEKVAQRHDQDIQRLVKENQELERMVEDSFSQAFREHASEFKLQMNQICAQMLSKEQQDKRSKQLNEWRHCKRLIDELLFVV